MPVACLAVLAAACGGGEDLDGLWLLTSIDIDGEPIPTDRPIFVEIEGDSISGNTTCNDFGGTRGGELQRTAKACLPGDVTAPDPMEVERAMIDAIRDGGSRDGQQLVFAARGTRLVYDAVVDPAPADLFAVLDDDSRAADIGEIFLDPEAGSHPEYETLVRLDHPSPDARFYLGVEGELVCFVVSADAASMLECRQPRFAARQAGVRELRDRQGPAGPRSAFIPDAFVAAAGRLGLGVVAGNVIVVPVDAEPGRYVISNAAGDEFTLDVPAYGAGDG